MPVGDDVDVGELVVVADQAEADAPVVRHRRDRQRAVAGEERERVDLLELAAEQVQRELRPGDVRDEQVVGARREVQARGLGEDRRRREAPARRR